MLPSAHGKAKVFGYLRQKRIRDGVECRQSCMRTNGECHVMNSSRLILRTVNVNLHWPRTLILQDKNMP